MHIESTDISNQDHLFSSRKQPLFSIIIPVYNTEKFLKKCLDSCMNQDIDSIEIIVINNGSSGNTKKIVDLYPNVKYISFDQNQGVFEARRQGFINSTGKYILHCDSDDWFEKNILKVYARYLDQAPDLIVGQTVSVYNTHKEKSLWANKGLSKVAKQSFLELYLNRDFTSWAFWGKCFRREVFESAYAALDVEKPIVIWEDFLLFTSAAIFCKNVIYVPKVSFYYRINADSFTHNITLSSIQTNLVHIDEVMKNLTLLEKRLNLPSDAFLAIRKELYLGFVDRLSHVIVDKEFASQILLQISNYFPPTFILDDLYERQNIRSHFIAETFTKFILKVCSKKSKFYNFLKRTLLIFVKK